MKFIEPNLFYYQLFGYLGFSLWFKKIKNSIFPISNTFFTNTNSNIVIPPLKIIINLRKIIDGKNRLDQTADTTQQLNVLIAR